MAKKITISELVIKLGMDTAAAVKQLRSYEKRLEQAQKKTLGAEAKAHTATRKRLKQAQAFLAGSREFHRLRRKSNTDAVKAEKALKRAYLQNDKIKINSIKRQIGERLQEHKAQDKIQSDLARNRLRSNRYLQQMQDRARKAAQRQAAKDARDKDRQTKEAERRQIRSRRMLQQMEDRSRKMAARGRREQEMADKRRLRHENHIARLQANQRKRFLNYMSQGSGTPISGISGAAMGVAGLTGAAMYQGSNNLLDFRRAENSTKAALSGAGSENAAMPQELIDTIQRNSDYFLIDRAQGMRAFSQARAAVSANKLTDEEVLYGNQGMAAASMVTGADASALSRAQMGLMQILTSGIQGQEIKQITENLTGAAPAVFKAVEELSGKKISGYGDIRNMSQKGELANIKGEDFFKTFTRLLNEQFLKEFEKMRGTLPYEQTRTSVNFDRALTHFSTGFEKPLIRILMNISSYIESNEEVFLRAGEMIGALAEKAMEVFGILYESAKPFLQAIYEFLMNTDANVLAAVIKDVGKLVIALQGLSILAGVARGVIAFAGAISFLMGIMAPVAAFLLTNPVGIALTTVAAVGGTMYKEGLFDPVLGQYGYQAMFGNGQNPLMAMLPSYLQDGSLGGSSTTTTNYINLNVPQQNLGATLSTMAGLGLNTNAQ